MIQIGGVVILFMIIGFIRIYSVRLASTTVWLAKVLTDPDLLQTSWRLTQNAITNGYPSTMNFCFSALPVVLAISTSIIFNWYTGIVAIIVMILSERLFQKLNFFSNDISHYIGIIISNLTKERSQYIKKAKHEKIEACDYFLSKLEFIDETFANINIAPPNYDEAMGNPLGSISYLLNIRGISKN